jgi:hypothetical protein
MEAIQSFLLLPQPAVAGGHQLTQTLPDQLVVLVAGRLDQALLLGLLAVGREPQVKDTLEVAPLVPLGEVVVVAQVQLE